MTARIRTPLGALLLLLAATGALGAQTVRGTVVDATSGAPVGGALVVLVDAAGGEHGGALTSARGAFVLRAGAPGTYTARAERVGHRSASSDALSLAAGQTASVRIALQRTPLELEGLVAESRRRCRPLPGQGPRTAALWEETRKALHGTAWAQRTRAFRFEAVLHRRDLNPRSLAVISEQRLPASVIGHTPFVSADPAMLAREGWVRADGGDTLYHAPDAEALLSDAFLDAHCFRAVQGDGRVGLAFEPVQDRRVPEIAGTLWLDAATGELRELEYRYVNLRVPSAADRIGGHVAFERVPGGAWIVRSWWIRMPALEVTRSSAGTIPGLRSDDRVRLASLREDGGEITAILTPDGRPVGEEAARAAIVGRVADAEGTPVAGARVFLSGTSLAAETGDDGRFRVDGVPAGRYTVSFTHPALAGQNAETQSVAVAPRDEVVGPVSLRLPPSVALAAAAAEDGESGAPLPLDPVEVRAARDAFARRAQAGRGQIVTREEIDRLRPVRTAELLRRFPGFEVIDGSVRLRGGGVRTRSGLSIVSADQARAQAGESGSGGRRLPANPSPNDPLPEPGSEFDQSLEDELGLGMTGCIPLIYVDGMQWQSEDGDLSFVHPDDVEAIEVYPRASAAPARYRRPRSECGIVLIWLRQETG